VDPNEDTHDPKNPPNSLKDLRVHSFALPWFIGALVTIIVLVGVVFLFWKAATPKTVAEQQQDAVGTSGYSTEGGHDPIRPLGTTANELKFRGDTQQPMATPPSASQRR